MCPPTAVTWTDKIQNMEQGNTMKRLLLDEWKEDAQFNLSQILGFLVSVHCYVLSGTNFPCLMKLYTWY